jgi:uncharacterized UBP type Zn finger protein
VAKQISEMEEQLHQVQEKIDGAFTSLKEKPYHLHSILIHDGTEANQGHYYSFNYD